MKFKKLLLFLSILNVGISASMQASDQVDPIEEMKTGSDLGNEFKEMLFHAKTNRFCKPDDAYCPSVCRYPTELAYQYFSGNTNSLWSLIPSISFASEADLNQWAINQNKDAYLILYKQGCPPCANLLAAVETRAQSLRSSNIDVLKINLHENQKSLGQNCWEYEGSPTVWKVRQGAVTEIPWDNKGRNFYRELIHLRDENQIPQNAWDYFKTNCAITMSQKWNYGFGYFNYDAKVLTACVAAGLLYGSYKLIQKYTKNNN